MATDQQIKDKAVFAPSKSKIDLKAMWSSLPTPVKVIAGIGAVYFLMLITSKLLDAGSSLKNSMAKFKGAGSAPKPPTINY